MPEWEDIAEEMNGIGATTRTQKLVVDKFILFRIVTEDPKDGCIRVMVFTAVRDPSV